VAEDVCGGASPSGGEEASLGGLLRERGRGTMAASWTVGVLASMAGGGGGGVGRTVAGMLRFFVMVKRMKWLLVIVNGWCQERYFSNFVAVAKVN